MLNKSLLKLSTIILFTLFIFFDSPQLSLATNCTYTPGGNVSISSACAFPGTVDGVDAGTGTTNTAVLTVATGATITLLPSQTLVVGSISLTGGSIVNIVGGSSIKIGTPLYITDADSDLFPANTTQYTGAGAGRVRRNTLPQITTIDVNDNQRCASADILSTASSALFNTTCKKCYNGGLTNQSSSEDIYTQCTTGSYSGCSGDTRTGGSNDTCNNAGACGTPSSSACTGATYCSSGSCSALTSPTLTAHTNDCGANANSSQKARATFSWNAVAGATSYTIWIFNGRAYEAHNIGNVTSWSSDGKGWWPTNAQIDAWAAGGWVGNIFCDGSSYCANGGGTNFPVDPNYMYLKAASTYTTTHGYYWTHISSNSAGGNSSGSPWAGATSIAETFPYYAGVLSGSIVCTGGACQQGQYYYTVPTCQAGYGLAWTNLAGNTGCSPTYPAGTAYDTQCNGACTRQTRAYGSNTCTAGSGIVWSGSPVADNSYCPTYPYGSNYTPDGSGVCTGNSCQRGQRAYGANTCTAGSGLYWVVTWGDNNCSPTYPAGTYYTTQCYGACTQRPQSYGSNTCTAGSGIVWSGTTAANTGCSPTYPAGTYYTTQCYGACKQRPQSYGSNTCTAGSGIVWSGTTASNDSCNPSQCGTAGTCYSGGGCSGGSCVAIVAQTTNWSAGTYGCGANSRCVSGTCHTCNTILWDDDGTTNQPAGQGGNACWRSGTQGASCDTACASYGGCVAANWNDTAWSMNVCRYFTGDPNRAGYLGGSPADPGMSGDSGQCSVRNGVQSCSFPNPDLTRWCVCQW